MLRVLFVVSRIYPESPSTKIGLLPLRRLDPSTKVGLPPLRDWIPGILPGRLTLSGSRGNCGLCPHLASSLLYIFFLHVLLIVRSSRRFVRMIVFSPCCPSSCDALFLCVYRVCHLFYVGERKSTTIINAENDLGLAALSSCDDGVPRLPNAPYLHLLCQTRSPI